MVRDPIERAWSGYKYNYIRALRPKSGGKPIPFDTMVRWEIDRVLNPCLEEHNWSPGNDNFKVDMSKQCFGKISKKKKQFNEIYSGGPDFNGEKWGSESIPGMFIWMSSNGGKRTIPKHDDMVL